MYDETIVTIKWTRDDIRNELISKEFESSEENVDKIINEYNLIKGLENAGIEVGWDIIHDAVWVFGQEMKERL